MTRAGEAARALVAGAIGAALLAAPGTARAHGPDPSLPAGAWPSGTALGFAWTPGAVPPPAVRVAAEAGAAGATDTARARSPRFAPDPAGPGRIGYASSVPCGTEGLACFRRSLTEGTYAVWLRVHGHRFDWGTLRWCQLALEDGCFDAANVVLDELGHVAGLDHHLNDAAGSDFLDAVVQERSRARPRAGWDARALGRCDVATLQRLYGLPDAATGLSTCALVQTVLELWAGRTAVVAGSSVTFTAGLRAGDGQGRLSGQPLAGRTVVLQRLETSGAWADVAVMAPAETAGRYVLAWTIRTGATWRAVFRRPAGEGAGGSSSAGVAITVGAACTSGPCPQALPEDAW